MGEHTPEPLKACPFCGSGSPSVGIVRDGREVSCRECHASGPPKYHGPGGNTHERAITAWNKRVEARADDAVRLLQKAVGMWGPDSFELADDEFSIEVRAFLDDLDKTGEG